jgi:peptidoglycan/xylan/chitin deacetylase (PgdA/CDA1 family)
MRIAAVAAALVFVAPATAARLDPQTTGSIGTLSLAKAAAARLPHRLRPSLPLLADWTATHPALRGRTLAAATDADIVLQPHEVILTFDDGPTTGRTDGVLKILDDFGVKATFMMVGKMAELHPESARAVALDGQTIGTHTYDHPNLSKLSPEAAFEEIQHGKDAVAAVLAPVGAAPTSFFRFPYLAETWLLEACLYVDGTIALGVQIDSDDYFNDSPQRMLKHLLARLDHEGKGIVLFHDIHAKTLVVLPQFLQALSDRGYTVVQLVAKTPSVFSEPVVTASR